MTRKERKANAARNRQSQVEEWEEILEKLSFSATLDQVDADLKRNPQSRSELLKARDMFFAGEKFKEAERKSKEAGK